MSSHRRAADAGPPPGQFLQPFIPLRIAGAMTLAGLLLSAGATLSHPPLGAVAGWDQGYRAIAADRTWVADHLVLAAGLLLLLPGGAAFHGLLLHRGAARLSALAALALLLALPLWLITLAWEITVAPEVSRAVSSASLAAPSLPEAVARGLWAYPMLVGYAAGFLMWAAVALWGMDLLRHPGTPRWWGLWGVLGGILGLAGLPLGALVHARWALWTMAATSAVAGSWFALAGYLLWAEPDSGARA
ncbi:hypothetical protein [Limnochorda pilosa]|uniref:DUF4386 family protein n=1 Tax=Limnochorda pilosa TaxID=1555112 RepID=A0A0K2SI49_LIMPI|nr:hypothetical protein [Limnochorda pilosa]BAS26524.1 hypothetical protein LIP_0667 [Limnochorda pilosa]